MKAIVCGGRAYANSACVYETLDLLELTWVVHGDADGADTLAKEWAITRGVKHTPYPAAWYVNGRLNRKAGPERNRKMLRENMDIECVIAFPGGTGTAHMASIARKAKIGVISIS